MEALASRRSFTVEAWPATAAAWSAKRKMKTFKYFSPSIVVFKENYEICHS
jgi:hypothetical protein